MEFKEVDRQDYQAFSAFLEKQCGIVLGTSKQYLVRSRLMPIVREERMGSIGELIDTVVRQVDRGLVSRVVDAMTTNETLWFRDNYPFNLLENALLTEFDQPGKRLRVWSAACSSGQEPYSIGMVISDFKKKKRTAFSGGVEIVATDLSQDMLTKAAQGKYDSLALARGLSDHYKRGYFESNSDGSMTVVHAVRNMVTFKTLNLLSPYAGMGKFDIVFCRNVLIYFSTDVKRQILQQIAACLAPGGILFLGASESLSGLCDSFEMVRCNPGLYYRKKAL